jgi:hypothetical protein
MKSPSPKKSSLVERCLAEKCEATERLLYGSPGDHGEEIERFTTDDPYGAVEAAREAQSLTLEERFDLYADRGW